MKKNKSIISLLLVFCMVISMLSLGAVPVSAAAAGHLVISEAYGGGGNSGAQYKNDFIELYNPTSSDVNLTGWKVQYASATGTTYSNYSIPSGMIKAGGYFLIQATAGTGGTVDLPVPDATCNIAMASTGFKIKLFDASNAIVDFVGAGSANEYEGSAAAPAPSNTTSIQRKDNAGGQSDLSNGWDTDNNGTDFYTAAPTPRNTAFGFEAAVANPTANPASGAVKIGTAITLSTTTAGAAITYKLNDGIETPYIEPIILDESAFVDGTATIKARAAKDGLTASEEVSFVYTVKALPEIITAQEAKGKSVGSEVRVKGIVTYTTQPRTIFMQDSSGGICVDSGSSSINISGYVGKEIDIIGTITLYGNMVQIKPASMEDITITNEAPTMPEPLMVSINELNTSNRIHEGKLIKVENAQIKTIGGTGTGTYNHTIIQGSDEITLRSGALTGRNTGDFITITGIAGYYNNPQVQANVTDIIDGAAPQVENVTADPVTGSTLPIGGTVTLSTSTADANIIYTLNSGAEQTIASNSGTVVIDAFQPDGKAIIRAKAVKGSYSSYEAAFTYTQAKTQIVTATPVGAVSGNSQIILTAATNATIRYIVTKKAGLDGESSDPEATYSGPIQITEDMLPVKITAYAVLDGYLPSDNATFDYYLASNKPYKNYFGQLHSHTAENSDGTGTLAEAYAYARDIAKLDFFAVTDHSNSFDNKPTTDKAGTYNLGDYNKDDPDWVKGQKAASDARRDNFISVYAYEMTWSGGPGHINTFATDGFVSRNNTELNTKTNDAGLKAYYQLLKDTPNSISQFNHPGETFGDFSDFAYLDPTIDARISLVEVGNGEGAVGSGFYFPSYDEYTKALDKGWHLAPTNNQDNHKGHWGDSNTARTVIYTNDLSVNGLYDALRDMRVYATEDNNLDIVYTLNGEMLGSIIQDVPGQASFDVSVSDPDSTDKIQSISIISNGGKDIYTQTYGTQNAALEKTINSPAAGYYYIKVVEEDGQIAVTAPIWLGHAPMIGIDSVGYDTMMPVTNEPVTFTTKLFNNELETATIKSISYKIKDGITIGTYDLNENIMSSGMYTHTLSHVFTQPGIFTVTVTAVLSLNGNDSIYTKDIEVNVRDSGKLVYVGIDASHDNEYVSGNYKDSMGNFAKLAAKFNVRVVELDTSEELISAMQNPKYKMMVFTVPSRRNGTAGRIPFKSYSQNEIDATADFAKSGRTVIVTGWGDYYEGYSNLKSDPDFTVDQHMAAQQNKLLSAIGANLRLADDEAKDNSLNGGQPQRLYLTDHNNYLDPFTQGIIDGQVFSQYGGSTVFAVDSNGNTLNELPTNIIPVISGHATTFSSDDDKDGNATPPKYNNKVLLMAHETVTHQDGTKSTVIVAGGAFMSNFEIQVEIDNAGTLPYSNYNILQNIIASITNISTIADVRNMPNGTDVVIEGIATTDVYNGSDNNKGFFDCIYVQDQTGGINLFPVASGIKEGQKARFYGKIANYQGEVQLTVSQFTILNQDINKLAPTIVSTNDSMSPVNTGLLVKTQGVVSNIYRDADGTVNQFTINDGTGPATVFINGYITKGIALPFITDGAIASVVGLASIGEVVSDSNSQPRIRVRDRSEIVKIEKARTSTSTSASNVVTGSIIDSTTGAEVSNITATVTTDSNGNDTISMSGSQILILKEPDGNVSSLSDISKIDITTDAGTSAAILSGGVIQVPNLAKGTDNNFNITYNLGNGQKIIIGTMNIKIDSNGVVTLAITMIDPYGTIIDASTGKNLTGVNVSLYYANTDRNKAAGKTPDTVVSLPGIDGFKPNNNKNPQSSDSIGVYGFMVYPDTDYYIVAVRDGYDKYISPTISVGHEVVKWNFKMCQTTSGVTRFAGLTRVDTALAIAKGSYTGKVSNVILTTADNYPDALAGSVLAYKLNAPVLLVGSTDADQRKVLDYMKSNLNPSGKVYILGGSAAVNSAMEAKVKSSGFSNITRIAGADRYETSVKIADSLGVEAGTPIVLVNGENYPDALSISSTAAAIHIPILLVKKSGISEAVKQKISEIKPSKIYIIGLQDVISATVENQVAQITGLIQTNVVRIGGGDRYATSLAVAQYFNLTGNACVTTGSDFPDALAGSVYAANHNAPIILVDKSLSVDEAAYLESIKLSSATIFGGESAVNNNIEQQLSQLLVK